jgi:hypothetical protein
MPRDVQVVSLVTRNPIVVFSQSPFNSLIFLKCQFDFNKPSLILAGACEDIFWKLKKSIWWKACFAAKY